MTNYFNVGKIVNTHGLQGEVRVLSTTDFKEERYVKGNRLFIFTPGSKEGIPVTIKSYRVHKNFDLLTFVEFQSINDVEKYKGSILKVNEEQLTPLPEGEYYYHELIGCEVETLDGKKLGEINEVLSTGANDVWVVRPKAGKDILIPYIESVVKDVNISNKTVKVELLEGLMDE